MTTPALYPELEPFSSGMLPVDDIHTLYWEESGNPQGIPVLFIHGGPGAGTSPKCRQFFDPSYYRIVLFDQRGSGKSTPMGEVRQNTTPLLVSDMEHLRAHLDIEHWHLFGGSWGSTLALAYAQTHPDRILSMVLRGIFLCRPQEFKWFYQDSGIIFPEAFRTFSEFLPEAERHDTIKAYHKRLNSGDPKLELEAATVWSKYEGICATLLPREDVVKSLTDPHTALCLAKIETHYFMNNAFLPPEGLLAHMDKIRHIPTIIVQGRYDIVCPIMSADALARAFPEADYIVVPNAGHSAGDPALQSELLKATEKVKHFK